MPMIRLTDEGFPYSPDHGLDDLPPEPYDWLPDDWPHEMFPSAVSTFEGAQPSTIPGQLSLETAGDYLIVLDHGGIRYKTTAVTLDEAHAIIEGMDSPDGYSRHEAILYVWDTRAVDNKPYLRTLERYWFGKRVDNKEETC